MLTFLVWLEVPLAMFVSAQAASNCSWQLASPCPNQIDRMIFYLPKGKKYT